LFDGIVTLVLAAMPAWLTSHTITRRSHSVAQVVCYLHQSIMPPVIILPLKTRTSNKTTMTVPMMISTVLVLLVVLRMVCMCIVTEEPRPRCAQVNTGKPRWRWFGLMST
jgi:hypothetical protein